MIPTILDSDNDSVNSQVGHMVYRPSPPISLDQKKRWRVRLQKCKLPFTQYDISSALGNNSLRIALYEDQAETPVYDDYTIITIPNGIYTNVSDIYSAIRYYLKVAGKYQPGSKSLLDVYSVTFATNEMTGKSYVTTSSITAEDSTEYKTPELTIIDLTNDGNSTFYNILGFSEEDAILTGDTTYISNSEIDMGHDASSWFYIHLNIIQSYSSTGGSSILYMGDFADPWAYSVIPEQSEVTMAPVQDNLYQINIIEVRITDSDNNLITFNSSASIHMSLCRWINSYESHYRRVLKVSRLLSGI